jgi:hypothetical protein
MKLSELKNALTHLEKLSFELPNGSLVPSHFHVTEIGRINKDFIDCGGTIRHEEAITMQLWESIDFHHRLKPERLLSIIAMSESKLSIPDAEIEVEYQAKTIGKYGLSFRDGKLKLTNKKTDCLATDACGIGAIKQKVSLSELKKATAECCSPKSGCC